MSHCVSFLVGEPTHKDLISAKRVRPSSIKEVPTGRSYISRGRGVRVEVGFRLLLPGVNSVTHLEQIGFLLLSLSVNWLPGARDNASVGSSLVQGQTFAQLVATLGKRDLSELQDVLVGIPGHHIVLPCGGHKFSFFIISLQSHVFFIGISDRSLIISENKPEVSDFVFIGVVGNEVHAVVTQDEVVAEAIPVLLIVGELGLPANLHHEHVLGSIIGLPVNESEGKGLNSTVQRAREQDHRLLGVEVGLDS